MPTSPLFAIPMLEGGSDYPTPDATADAKQINDQFKYAEQFLGVHEVTSTTLPPSPKVQEFVYETDTGRLRYWSGTEWVTVAYRTTGTTAQRDALYPLPSTSADRVALAAKSPRWFNTDKGYEQQYFAQFDDPGVGSTPARPTHGWAPSAATGSQVPLSVFTVAASAGTVVKKGSVVEYTAASNIELRGVFNADFLDYLLVMSNEAGPTSSDGTFQLLQGTVPYTDAGYGSNRIVSPASGTLLNVYAAATQAVAWQNGAQHSTRLTLLSPQAPKTTFWHSHGYSTIGSLFLGGGHVNSTQYDGIKIMGAGFTGRIDVYGIAR